MLNFSNSQYVTFNSSMRRTTTKLSEVIRRSRISACLRTIESKKPNADKWLAVIKYQGKSMAVDFFVEKGTDIVPTGSDAIKILLDTTVAVDNFRSFHEWARAYDLEYDLSAREMYTLQKEKSKEVRDFFGDQKFRELVAAEHTMYEDYY